MLFSVCENSIIVPDPADPNLKSKYINHGEKDASQEEVFIVQINPTVNSHQKDKNVCQEYINMILVNLRNPKVVNGERTDLIYLSG
jgi:hypothetical protein